MPYKHYNQLETTTFDDTWITTISNNQTDDVYQISLAELRNEIINGADISPASIDTQTIRTEGHLDIISDDGFMQFRAKDYLTIMSDNDQINIKAEGEGNIVNIPGMTGSVRIEDGSMSVSGPLTAGTGVNVADGNLTVSTGDIVVPTGDITASSGDITTSSGDIRTLTGNLEQKQYAVSLHTGIPQESTKKNDNNGWAIWDIELAGSIIHVDYDYRGMYSTSNKSIIILSSGVYIVSLQLGLAYDADTSVIGPKADIVRVTIHDPVHSHDYATYYVEDSTPHSLKHEDFHLRTMSFISELNFSPNAYLAPRVELHCSGPSGLVAVKMKWNYLRLSVRKTV